MKKVDRINKKWLKRDMKSLKLSMRNHKNGEGVDVWLFLGKLKK